MLCSTQPVFRLIRASSCADGMLVQGLADRRVANYHMSKQQTLELQLKLATTIGCGP